MVNVPRIRFKHFSDAWEQHKLGDMLDRYEDPVETPHDGYERIGIRSHAKGVFHSYVEPGKELDTAKMHRVAADKFILNITFAWEHAVAITEEEDAGTLVSHRFPQFSFHKDLKSHFFKFLMLDRKFREYLELCSPGGAGRNRVLNINDMLKYKINVPSVEEQTKIGEYFDNLDNLITLHQRKSDETKTLKKYMLQKMFPQNGERVPEIRFAGFTGDWEQRKFSDFTWNAGKRNSQNLDLDPYAVTNDRGFIRQNEAHDEFGYMKDVDRKAYNIVMPNSFAYNPARINVGSIGYYEGTENVIVSSLYEVFQTADYVDDRFLWHWFKSDIFPKWIERLQEGSVRLYFYYDKLCECKMLMPSLPEQRKIAVTLDEIDNIITLHQCKCDELKSVKKYMLGNMFPENKG
ncbi:type I restriction enzyme, S subunit [Lachnospiraceae bacterium YSD2013]|nr:type I restriction enzyme, S subunit [Lachnospiraceae bacterium YSD2013]